eukprot:scaffold244_cov126-Skeletonema_dohrnii-CCMP3373.AAC.2
MDFGRAHLYRRTAQLIDLEPMMLMGQVKELHLALTRLQNNRAKKIIRRDKEKEDGSLDGDADMVGFRDGSLDGDADIDGCCDG